MKRLLLLALAAAFAACSPDIPIGPDNSTKYVEAEFDPAHSVIPLPNDLVFLDASGQPDVLLHAPETGGTDAQNEFNRDYLNLLDGFPMESTASMLFAKPIDPASIQLFLPPAGGNLAVFDITDTANPLPVSAVNVTTAAAANGAMALNILPKSGFWTRGHHYAVMVLGGANGIKGASSGQTVTGSPTWALVISSTPLVTCDTNGNNCVLGTNAIPTTEKDPAKQYEAQVRVAKQLEGLRLNYAPVINGALAAVPGLNRTDIALVWTFKITSHAEVTFDPANSIIPFPNDILLGSDGGVQFPKGIGLPDALVDGLNTLDGFSNSAPIVSENGTSTGALIQGTLPGTPYTLGPTSPINMLAVPGSSRGADAGAPLNAFACVNCTVSPTLLDGGTKPETLEIVPRLPLTERTQYAIYITTDLVDSSGKNVIPSPVFALARSSAPLYANGKSTVSLLTDDQAQQLEQLRAGLKPLFDDLAQFGLPRKKVALAWAFTTQSTVSTLSRLHAAPTLANVPATPLWAADVTAAVTNQLDGLGVPHNAISAFWAGEIYDLWALNSTHFMPGLSDAVPKKMPFIMAIPAGTAPTSGWPVTVFGHGLFGDKTNAYAIANTLASLPAGNAQVTIAIDEPWHGDRNTCIGFGNYLNLATHQTLFTDAYACSDPTTQECNAAGRCQLKNRGTTGCTYAAPTSDLVCLGAPPPPGQGACAPDNHCEGAGAGFASFITVAPGVIVPVAGWNLINLVDFFATRDNIRQQVISHAQLARVIATAGPAGINTTPPGTAVKLDPTKLSFVSQSIGSFLGSLYTAVAPEVGNTALNVAGSDWVLNLLTSPTFVPYKNAFIAGLAAEGVEQNSPAYDQFLGIAKWIIDPADPLNAAYYLTHSANLPSPLPPNINPATRRALVQWVLDDTWVVNPSTVELVNAAAGSVLADTTRVSAAPLWSYQYNNATNLGPGNALSNVPASSRHGFLLSPYPNASGAALTGSGQQQIGTFLTGAPPPFP